MICIRCKKGVLEVQAESDEEIQFFTCKDCGWHFTRSPGGDLHDRWLSPLSLVLYSQIYERNPRTTGKENAIGLSKEIPDKISLIIEEIERELNHPTQKVSDIFDFIYPDEDGLRDHLKDVAETLKILNA